MGEIGKYTMYVVASYGVTVGLLIILGLQTWLDFTHTRNKLASISKKKSSRL